MTVKTSWRAAVGLGLLGLVLALGWSCAERRDDRCRCAVGDARVLDEQLMLLLSTARSYHHQADIYLQQGDTARAMAAIRSILVLGPDGTWPEMEEVRLDAAARLAKLLLGQGKEAEALELAERVLQGARRDSFYLANLHSVRGEVLERRAERLKGEGKQEQARAAAREAIAAFERSITINKKLQRRLLDKGNR